MNICRLCSKSNQDLDILSDSEKDIVKIIIPQIDLKASDIVFICKVCSKLLQQSFAFKSKCLEIEDSIHDFKQDKIQVNLEKVLGIYEDKNGKCVKICRTCLGYLENGVYTELSTQIVLRHTFEKCLPEMDVELTKNPVMCKGCEDMLSKVYTFIMQCIKNEENMKSYFEYSNNKNVVERKGDTGIKNYDVVNRTVAEVSDSEENFASDNISIDIEELQIMDYSNVDEIMLNTFSSTNNNRTGQRRSTRKRKWRKDLSNVEADGVTDDDSDDADYKASSTSSAYSSEDEVCKKARISNNLSKKPKVAQNILYTQPTTSLNIFCENPSTSPNVLSKKRKTIPNILSKAKKTPITCEELMSCEEPQTTTSSSTTKKSSKKPKTTNQKKKLQGLDNFVIQTSIYCKYCYFATTSEISAQKHISQCPRNPLLMGQNSDVVNMVNKTANSVDSAPVLLTNELVEKIIEITQQAESSDKSTVEVAISFEGVEVVIQPEVTEVEKSTEEVATTVETTEIRETISPVADIEKSTERVATAVEARDIMPPVAELAQSTDEVATAVEVRDIMAPVAEVAQLTEDVATTVEIRDIMPPVAEIAKSTEEVATAIEARELMPPVAEIPKSSEDVAISVEAKEIIETIPSVAEIEKSTKKVATAVEETDQTMKTVENVNEMEEPEQISGVHNVENDTIAKESAEKMKRVDTMEIRNRINEDKSNETRESVEKKINEAGKAKRTDSVEKKNTIDEDGGDKIFHFSVEGENATEGEKNTAETMMEEAKNIIKNIITNAMKIVDEREADSTKPVTDDDDDDCIIVETEETLQTPSVSYKNSNYTSKLHVEKVDYWAAELKGELGRFIRDNKKPLFQYLHVFVCNLCPYNSRSALKMAMHCSDHTKEKVVNYVSTYHSVFFCVSCAVSFGTKPDLQKHVDKCPQIENKMVFLFLVGEIMHCTKCYFDSDDEKVILMHLKNCPKIGVNQSENVI